MRKIILTLLISVSVLSGHPSFMQFSHLTIADGLSQSSVFATIQDSRGFMWFGTQDGLNRYDGYTFKQFNNGKFQTTRISHNEIRALFEDQSGHIWIGTWGGGVDRFDPVNEKITHLKIDALKINAFAQSPDSGIWIGSAEQGLIHISVETGTISKFVRHTSSDSGLFSNNVTALANDGADGLWIATSSGLNYLDYDTGHISKIHNKALFTPMDINAICPESGGRLWIGTGKNGLWLFDALSGNFRAFDLGQKQIDPAHANNVLCITRIKDSAIWVGTYGGGLTLIDPVTFSMTHIESKVSFPQSLGNNTINTIYESRSGLIWLGTNGSGIDLYDENQPVFARFRYAPGEENSLSNPFVWGILEDAKKRLWVCTDDGLNCFTHSSKQTRIFQHQADNPNSISSSEVQAIVEDPDDPGDVFWIGTWHGGLNRYDNRTHSFRYWQHESGNPNSLTDDRIRVLYFDPISNNDIIWIGTANGLNRFDKKSGRVTRFLHDPDNSASLSDNSILSIYRDRGGLLWVGTWGGGLNRLNEDGETFTHYFHAPDDSTTISSNAVSTIYEDRFGIIWLGTHGGGLNRFDRRSGKAIHFRKYDGLPNDVIYGILEDDDGYFWISTNRGISRFDPRRRSADLFKNYTDKDGLQSNEFNNGAYFKAKDGDMFFGGINGLSMFNPQHFKKNDYVPPIAFTHFRLFNTIIQPDNAVMDSSITYIKQIALDYDQSMITIEFSALNFSTSAKSQYAYQLVGFNQDWIRTTSERRFATYTNLDPGEYTFHVRASNNDGVWNVQGARLKLIIAPPFWKTWWFYLICGFFSAGFIFAIYRLRVRRYRMQQQILEQQVELRTNELRRQTSDLQKALGEVKQLGGLLPICASCKKIRDDRGYWNQIETYISEHSEADFSHSLCPDCASTLYPNHYKKSK